MSETLPAIYCLGVKALGPCNFDLSNPSLTFFSIGQLATVITLIFAFGQLAKPIVKFRIATRRSPQWVPQIGLGLTIIFVFLAALVRALPVHDYPVIGFPIFWEFFAGLCLVCAGLIMIVRVTTETCLSSHNAIRYLNGSRSIIARGSVDDLREYGDEIVKSISTVVSACMDHQKRSLVAPHNTDNKLPPTDFERVCYTLLDLWADKQFCQILITRCPGTAIQILLEVQNQRLYESGAYALIQGLIGQAMSNSDSILHREGDYSGLGRTKSFMTTAFGNTDFVNSRLRPLQAWKIYDQEHITKLQVERYSDAIEIAMRAAIGERHIGGLYSALSCALDVVNDIARKAAMAMTRIPESEISKSEWAQVLGECGDIHCKVIKAIATLPAAQQPSAQEAQIDPATYDSIKDNSIYKAVANNAFEYVENLAICKGHDEHIRFDIIGLWEVLFPHHAPVISLSHNAIRQRFLFALREKIDQNLDIENWYYPMVIRVLVAMWGISDCPGDVQPLPDYYSREESELYVYVYTTIKQNFVAIRQKNPEHANDLLPQTVDYVDEPPSLRQTRFRGKTSTLSLRPPAS